MQRPEMIIFDYGHTLLYEPKRSSEGGNRAIFPYIKGNGREIGFEEYDATMTRLLDAVFSDRNRPFEIHEHLFLRSALEYMNALLSIPMLEAEKIIMRGISEGAAMPSAGKMLDYLNGEGIRTAVISNLCFSSDALRCLLDRLLPNNRFEFVLASSDYVFRKPHPFMFELALKRAGLTADKAWYCGDSIRADVYGAHGVGMFPVWYEGDADGEPSIHAEQNKELTVGFEHLHIRHWDELIDTLEKLKMGII